MKTFRDKKEITKNEKIKKKLKKIQFSQNKSKLKKEKPNLHHNGQNN
jgi:hypothetical protein